MTDLKYDVAGIGNALVDVISNADDAFLTANGIEKGGMTLIDAERADALYAKMAPGVESSGGSCANTIAGLASLGGKGAFSARSATTSSAKSSCMTSSLSASHSRPRSPKTARRPGAA